jgi:hypothetical protein
MSGGELEEYEMNSIKMVSKVNEYKTFSMTPNIDKKKL